MTNNETTKAKEQKIYRVAVLTPYLIESIQDISKWARDRGKCPVEVIEKQSKLYGYDPKNLNGKNSLETQKKNRVLLETPKLDGFTTTYGEMVSPLKKENILMAIAGCTEDFEDLVKRHKGSGLLFARYSIFYGNKSNYTGNSAETAGYSFDIPKDVETVKALLRSDAFLESLVAREECRIARSLDALNKKLKDPVLATPYLKEALEARR